MTYIGEIHNGVVVLKDAPRLHDGTRVRVEVDAAKLEPRRGSSEAVLDAVGRLGGSWADSADEMDEAIEYLRKTKLDEVRFQQASEQVT
jgi:hypothetical protein